MVVHAELRLATDMSTTTLARLGKNENVSMDVMLRICKVLDCKFDDQFYYARKKRGNVHKLWFYSTLLLHATKLTFRYATLNNPNQHLRHFSNQAYNKTYLLTFTDFIPK